MSNVLRFCSSVSLNDVNPMNHALRNDYISNLVGLGFKTLTILETLTKEPIRVVSGFKSVKCKPHKHFVFDKFLCSGNALEVTCDNYELLKMMEFAKKVAKGLRDNNISVILFEDTVMFVTGFDEKCGVYRWDGRAILVNEF